MRRPARRLSGEGAADAVEPAYDRPQVTSLADSREGVLDAEHRGEFLMAFDLADRALREYPDDLWLRHRAVLALARAGSTGEATRRFAEYGLNGIADEDIAALQARIAKDAALAQPDALLRRRDAASSAHLYETIFRDTRGYYPAVNAATMYMVGGQPQLADTLAKEALEAIGADDDSYYAHATVAEA